MKKCKVSPNQMFLSTSITVRLTAQEIERDTYIQTERQTEKQKDRQKTKRQKGGETNKQRQAQ